jgi:hypothetical protein
MAAKYRLTIQNEDVHYDGWIDYQTVIGTLLETHHSMHCRVATELDCEIVEGPAEYCLEVL